MKTKMATVIAMAVMSAPVIAQNLDKKVFANQNVKAIELSQAEMQETQGEFALNAGGAALVDLQGEFRILLKFAHRVVNGMTYILQAQLVVARLPVLCLILGQEQQLELLRQV